MKPERFSTCFAQKTAAEETSTRQAICGPHLLLAFAVFVQSRVHCSQIRCPTTRTRLLLLQKKISQTEHWLFAEITIKIAIMRFIPSCCNGIDLSTLVLLTPLFTCKCDRAKHHVVLQRCYAGVLFEWNHSHWRFSRSEAFRVRFWFYLWAMLRHIACTSWNRIGKKRHTRNL